MSQIGFNAAKISVMQTFDRFPREGLADENTVMSGHAVIWSLKGWKKIFERREGFSQRRLQKVLEVFPLSSHLVTAAAQQISSFV